MRKKIVFKPLFYKNEEFWLGALLIFWGLRAFTQPDSSLFQMYILSFALGVLTIARTSVVYSSPTELHNKENKSLKK